MIWVSFGFAHTLGRLVGDLPRKWPWRPTYEVVKIWRFYGLCFAGKWEFGGVFLRRKGISSAKMGFSGAGCSRWLMPCRQSGCGTGNVLPCHTGCWNEVTGKSFFGWRSEFDFTRRSSSLGACEFDKLFDMIRIGPIKIIFPPVPVFSRNPTRSKSILFKIPGKSRGIFFRMIQHIRNPVVPENIIERAGSPERW